MTEPRADDKTIQFPHSIEPRRLPVQARSKERVDRILDAAAQLLAEEGYSAVKTNHIAKRAGVSIGSVYQFFPNRLAIFHALAARYQDQSVEMLDEYMGPNAKELPWEQTIDNVVNMYGEMWRREWSFFAVWIAIQNTAELRESDEIYVNNLVNNNLIYFLRSVMGNARDEELDPIARTMFEVSNILLHSSMRKGPEQDMRVVEELKVVLKSYLQHHIDRFQERT